MECNVRFITTEAVHWSSPGHRAGDAPDLSPEAVSRIVTRAPGGIASVRGLAQQELQYCPRDEPPAPAIFGRQLPLSRGDLAEWICRTSQVSLQVVSSHSGTHMQWSYVTLTLYAETVTRPLLAEANASFVEPIMSIIKPIMLLRRTA
ncbi:hypothetical protein VE03_10154 [Pseudogymnoascus sp. 23342-1-I1]|nr:hypothetical protein VE03_10154 [Pseudogymnoascus sp. 23342-1-I1]